MLPSTRGLTLGDSPEVAENIHNRPAPARLLIFKLSHETPHMDVTRRARAKYFFREYPNGVAVGYIYMDAELNAQFETRLDLGHLYPTLPPLLSDPAQAAPHYLIVLNVCLRSQRRTQLAT